MITDITEVPAVTLWNALETGAFQLLETTTTIQRCDNVPKKMRSFVCFFFAVTMRDNGVFGDRLTGSLFFLWGFLSCLELVVRLQ